jgi:hypothetical protein
MPGILARSQSILYYQRARRVVEQSKRLFEIKMRFVAGAAVCVVLLKPRHCDRTATDLTGLGSLVQRLDCTCMMDLPTKSNITDVAQILSDMVKNIDVPVEFLDVHFVS